MAIKTGPEISDQTSAWILDTFPKINSGMTYISNGFPSLYRATLHDMKGTFSPTELSLMIDVFNGLILTPQLAGQHIALQVANGIKLDSLDEKWGINGLELMRKIDSMTLFDRACLEIWLSRYWKNGDKDMNDYVQELTR
jgi:hypothetical protein